MIRIVRSSHPRIGTPNPFTALPSRGRLRPFLATALFAMFMLTGLQAQITSATLNVPGPYCPGQAVGVNYGGTGTGISLFLSNTNSPGTFANPAIATAPNPGGLILGDLPFDLAPGTYNFRVTNSSVPAGGANTGNFTVSTRTLTGNYSSISSRVCVGDQITVPFSTNCAFPANSQFTLELSQANGNFPGTVISGAPVIGTGTGSISGTIPNVTESLNYRVRVVSNQSQNTIGQTISAASNTFEVKKGTTVTNPGGPFCQGQQNITVSFTPSQTTTYLVTNFFRLELSDASGSFATPTVLDEIPLQGTGVGSGSFTFGLPFNIPFGTGYRVRVVSTNPIDDCPPIPSAPFTINGPGPLTVNDVTACLGDMATFTANFGSPMNSTTFQWYKMCVGPFVNTTAGLTTGNNPAVTNEVVASGSNVYVATGAGLSISTNSGGTYTLVPIAGNLAVYDVAVSGTNVYAATNNGIYWSTTGGAPGSFTNQVLSGTFINSLFVSGTNVFAGTSNGVYVFTNTMSQIFHFTTANGLGSNQVNAVYVEGPRLYAATGNGLSINFNYPLGIFSPFFNRTFLNSSLAADNVRSVFVAGNVVYAGTTNGLSVSTNFGFTFADNYLPGESINDLWVSNGLIYVATNNGLKIGTNGSSIFTDYKIEDGLGQNAVNGVFVAPGNVVYAATGNGISKGTASLTPIPGANGSSYSFTVAYPDALCRYQVRAQNANCPAASNFGELPVFVPQISLASAGPASTCASADGFIEIQGLTPNAPYKISYTGGGSGSPSNGAQFTADVNGRFRIKFLPGGTYTVQVLSNFSPSCPSNTLTVVVARPAEPGLPSFVSAPAVCVGQPLKITMGALGVNEEYRWFTNAATTTTSNPMSSGPVYMPMPAPLNSGSYWVRIRNTLTQCVGDSLKVDYIMNTGLSITTTKTNPTTPGGNDGSITISGLAPNANYTLNYGGLVGTPAAGPVVSDANGKIVITGFTAGDVTGIFIVDPTKNCPSNGYNCTLFDPTNDPALDKLQTVVCEIPGVMGGYLQQIDPTACADGSTHISEGLGAIAVGRIRQSVSLPVGSNDKVEMRGYVKFDLSRIPTNATITKVEYRPKAIQGGFRSICDIDQDNMIISATGDIQFDITQVQDGNYSPYTNFNPAVFQDLYETKYNDFVIAADATGAITNLGQVAVEDVQRRLKGDKLFQIGLHLSGNDFDLPVFQFHGIVFAPSAEHELCISYTLRDYGDLPEPKYATDIFGGLIGPSHVIDSIDLDPTSTGINRQPAMFIGATPPDPELNGQPSALADGDNTNGVNDENINRAWFTNAATADSLIAGNTIDLKFNVTNNLAAASNVVAFIDWDGDGVFENDTERFTTTVGPGTSPVTFNLTIPTYATGNVGVRIRMSSAGITDAYGPMPDGEVEDYLLQGIRGFDYADLPDAEAAGTAGATATGNYETIYAANGSRGPRHLINADLKIGNLIDAEGNGQPQINAFGDDINGIDDEDGVIPPDSVVRGAPARFKVFVTNKTNAPAYLVGFVDWNDDGSFEDGSPNQKSATITIPAGVSGYYNVDFVVPTSPSPLPDRVASRFRLSNENTAVRFSTGPAQGVPTDIQGEVEDLWVSIVGYDWADLYEPRYITDKAGGQPGPSHKIRAIDHDNNPNSPNVYAMYIGATPPDPETDAFPGKPASGDDLNGVDDEDLAESNFLHPTTLTSYPLISSTPTVFRVPVTNNSNRSATLWAFIDWNGDGSFTGPGETNFKTVSAGFIGNMDFSLLVPNIGKPDSIGVRVRLTSGAILDAYGQAPDGEVEDFMVELRGVDFGDLPDVSANVAPNDFQTTSANNGPRHGVQVKPLTFMGKLIDTETDGKPNGEADGDDKDIQPDDEDGIIFLGPLVPGRTAQLSFTGTNNNTNPATLHMWADWNGDGILEYVSGTTIAAITTVNAQIITFNVPSNATFLGGKVYFRFRFTTDPVFNANPQPTGAAWDGEVEDYYKPIFKLGNLVWEDRNHNGLQDAEEINLGIKNVRIVLRYGGVNTITGAFDSVTQKTATNPRTIIVDGGKDLIRDSILQTFTDDKGLYCFTGLIEGAYQVIAVDTFGLTPTRFDWIKNVTEEDLDSDGKPLKNPWDYVSGDRRQSKSQTFLLTADRIGTDEEGILDQGNPQLLDPNALNGFPDERVEQRLDFGYVGLDLGDLAESGNNPSVTNFITTENGTKPEGPKHIVTPDLRLGKCQDVEWQGQPDQDAGAEFKPGPDAGGDDPIANFSNYPNFPYDPSQGRRWPFHDAANACGDDEDGIRFLTPMVPGYNALMSVKYHAKLNLDGPDAYLHTWIDWNGDGNFDDGAGNYDPDEHIRFSLLDGKPAILEPNTKALELEMNYLVNANDSIVLTFKVPANVKYNNGNILSRFRISFDPRIGPNGILAPNLNFPDPQPGAVSSQVPGGVIPYGEVEDYFISLAKVGNTVFEDRDYDGFQDVLEPGIANVPIKLQFAGADGILNNGDPYEFTYHDTTDANGRYFFCGLLGNVDPSGIPNPVYQLIVSDPAGMTATFNNPDPSDDACIDDNSNGDDLLIDNRITTDTFTITNPMMLCLDENAPRNDVGGLVAGNNLPPSADALNNFPDNQYDETRDFGYTGFDYGDLPINSVLKGSKYLTLRDSMNAQFNNLFGARHAIQPRLFLGRGVDGELNGKPDADAGSKAGGDDDDQGAFKKGLTADDETGVRLLSPLIPGEYAYIKVNYTSQDTAAGGYVNRTAYLDAFIDWNGDGVLDPTTDEKVLFTHQAFSTGSPFSTNNVPDIADTRTPVLPATGANGVDSTILAFLVPTNAVYDTGTVFMRYRLGWTNYSATFPTAFPNGLEPDNNKFHMKTSPYVKSFENNLPLGAPVTFNDVAGDLGRYPYPQGEVEDYAIPVAKIGNLAWFDHDVFGDQDANEDVVDSLHLVLIWGGVNGATGAFDTVGYQTNLSSLGAVTDILYNRSIAPPGVGTYTPGALVKTGISPAQDSGMYSFRGLIPGIYYVLPLKYFATDSATFVNAWPKHRVVTLQDNPGVDDNNDSDGITTGVSGPRRGPGAFVKIADGNNRQPEVCVNDRPLAENGKQDAQDNANPFTPVFFPDNQWDKSVDIGWVDEPNVEASMDIVGVNFPTSQICGNFNVITHLCIKNPQEVPLDSLQMFFNLLNAYGPALYTASKPIVTVVDSAFVTNPKDVKIKKSSLVNYNTSVNAKAKDLLVVNPNYNGTTDTRLLIPTSESANFILRGDSILCLQIEFEIDPTKTANYPWMLSALVSGRAVGFNKQTGLKRPLTDFRYFHPRFGKTIVVYDSTDEFDDPMPMASLAYPLGGDNILFEGMVADRGLKGDYQPPYVSPNVTGRDKYIDEDDKAIMNDSCWIKTKWNSGYQEFQIGLDENCEAIINADKLVPNYIPVCGFDKYPMGSYYRVIIQDKHTEETLWASVDRVPFDASKYLDRKLIYKVRSVANHCNVIWGPIIFVDKLAPVVTCPPTTSRKLNSKNRIVGTHTFICSDIDSVLNVTRSWADSTYAYYTGIATATDACSTPRLDNVKDEIVFISDCALSSTNGFIYAQIRRTFTFADAMGNKGICHQLINFYRPRIVLPVCKILVPNNKAKGDTLIALIDLVGKKYELPQAVPHYVNGAGNKVYITGQDLCGFAFNYKDEVTFVTGEEGGCGKKIIRHWSIFDWCYGKGENYPNYVILPDSNNTCYTDSKWEGGRYSWKQTIVVGDDEKPIIQALDIDNDGKVGHYSGEPQADPKVATSTYDPDDVLTFSTGPMDCTGSFIFNRSSFKVIEQSDWCYDIKVFERVAIKDLDERPTGKFEMKLGPTVTVKGDCAKGFQVTGVPMVGDWFVQVRVYDACYSSDTAMIPIRILDKIVPVMKCDDKFNITLDNLGNGHIAAKDLDEGSWDNCKLKWVKVRRPVTDACQESLKTIIQYVDANKNGKIDSLDYVDLNKNRKADEGEFFEIAKGTKQLMTPLMDTVPFFCCDGGSLMVELWGEDKFGNRNFCWHTTQIEDKTPVECIAPSAVRIFCTDKNLGTLDSKVQSARAFGDVVIVRGATCAAVDTTYTTVKKLKCGAGTIERIWTLTKKTAHGPIVSTCKQIITVLPLREYDIRFPKDVDTRDCSKPLIDTLKVDEHSCDILAINITDKRYDKSADECYKIFRTYTVIDWCAYDERCGDPMAANVAYVVDRKYSDNGLRPVFVLVRDEDRNQREEFYLSADDVVHKGALLSDGIVEPKNNNDESFTPNFCEIAFSGSAEGLPTGAYIHSFMYTQVIKVYDDIQPVVSVVPDTTCIRDGGDCLANPQIIVNAKDNCTDDVTMETNLLMVAPFQTLDRTQMILYSTTSWEVKKLDKGKFEVNIKDLPMGKHDLIVVVRDECGNLSAPTRIPLIIEDCKGPAPICINGLSIELMPNGSGDGSALVWATDFVASKIFDCNGQGPETQGNGKLVTKYSINRVGSPVSATQTSLAFNCKDAGKIIQIELHAWDELGNHDFCVTFIQVQDNNKACGGTGGTTETGQIAGLILTDDAEPVQSVAVEVGGASTQKANTGNNGGFNIDNLKKGGDYTVSAQHDKDHGNGVSTFDLVLIQKHILNVQPITSPYRLIAADVNNSKTITTLDLIQIRKLILQIDDKFKSVPSWKFIDATYKFPDATNPFAQDYPEVININNLTALAKADFVAVKMGDVNGNAATSPQAVKSEIRTNRAFLIEAKDELMRANQQYEIPVRARDLQQIQGYQFTLKYDLAAVELLSMDYGLSKTENFGVFADKGLITSSWNTSTTAKHDPNAYLFTLVFKAKTTAKVSDVLKINSQLTAAEAYDVQNQTIGVKLTFDADRLSTNALLHQNQPNPFSDETLIGFYLPKAAKGTLTIRDAKGSLVYSVKAQYVKGENTVLIKRNELRDSGVFYYTFETEDFVDTKKMVLLTR